MNAEPFAVAFGPLPPGVRLSMHSEIHTAEERAPAVRVAPLRASHASEPSPFESWRWQVGILGLCCAGAAVLSGSSFQTALFLRINAWPRWSGGEAWLLFSLLGEGTVLLGLAALLVQRRPGALWPFVLAAACLVLLLLPLKELFSMPRPLSVLGDDVVLILGRRLGKYGFPSGHTATAFLGAHVMWSWLRERPARWTVLFLASLCGLSRIAIGAHWPADVIVGAGLGWCCGGVGLALARRLRWGCGSHTATLVALVLASASVVFALFRSSDGFLSLVRDGIGLASLCGVALLGLWDLRRTRTLAG